MKHGACITAAGASSRMGYPKALLSLPDGTPLAVYQTRQLAQIGCEPIVVVIGAEADRITYELDHIEIVLNPRWGEGRLTSIQAGLRALKSCDGCFILPVDVVGMKPSTLESVKNMAERGTYEVVRPVYQGKPGHLVWCSRQIMAQIAGLDIDPDTPLNKWLMPFTHYVEVDDPAIRRNLNTPDAWAEWVMGLRTETSHK